MAGTPFQFGKLMITTGHTQLQAAAAYALHVVEVSWTPRVSARNSLLKGAVCGCLDSTQKREHCVGLVCVSKAEKLQPAKKLQLPGKRTDSVLR